MELVQLKPHLYVPTDFGKHHHYYADAEGTKEYTGITSILGVLSKPALIGWAAKEACKKLGWLDPKYTKADERLAVAGTMLAEIAQCHDDGEPERFLAMLDEAVSAHTRKKEEAGAHGTDAHALVEEYINYAVEHGVEVNYEVPRWMPITPFITWAIDNVDHFLFAERRMAHPELFVAGTADFAAVMKDGKKLMGDFKTSSGIYGIDYWLQVSAYRLLAEYEGDEPYDGSVIVRLGKKGPSDFEVQYLYDYETFRDAFLACLTIYRAQAAIKGMTVH